jgi:iron(III) transport system permease protein
MRAPSRPPSPTLPHKGEGSPLWTPLLVIIAVVLVAWLALVPLGFMLWQSVLSPDTATAPARFTLDNYRTAYASADTARLLANSLQFALGSALLAFSLGTLLAWINERTDTPFKVLFFALTLVPLIIPGILFTVSWIFLGSPKIGIVNLVLQRVFATETVFINI